jgi:hypothetical protein
MIIKRAATFISRETGNDVLYSEIDAELYKHFNLSEPDDGSFFSPDSPHGGSYPHWANWVDVLDRAIRKGKSLRELADEYKIKGKTRWVETVQYLDEKYKTDVMEFPV